MTQERVSQLLHRHFLVLAGTFIAAVALAQAAGPIVLDDAYITFRSSWNFAQGNGLVFNAGENVFSTTAPGFALLLGMLAKAGFGIVPAAKVVCAAALAAAGLSLLAVGRILHAPAAGFVAGIALCCTPDLLGAWGNEASVLVACAAVGWLLFLLERPAACGVVMALGCTVRPDFALACIAFAAAFAARRSWRALIWYSLPGLLIGAAWIAFLAWQFGSPIPHTLRVKIDQGKALQIAGTWQAAMWCSFAEGLARLLRRTLLAPWFGILAVAGGAASLLCPRVLPIAAWCALHVGAYAAMGVPGHFAWYFYPVWFAAAVFLGIGAQIAVRVLDSATKGESQVLQQMFLAALSMHVAAHGLAAARSDFARNKFAAYNEIAARLNRRMEPGQSVLLGEIGQIGFLTGARVLDSHGIIHNFPRRELLYDWNELVKEYEPDFIVYEGWAIDADFKRSARAGQMGRDFTAKDGGTIRYDQVETFDVEETMQPVILQRRRG